MNTEYYNRILRFLNNEMSFDERSAFENELIKNNALKEDLEFERSLIENGASLKKKLDDLEGSDPAANSPEVYESIKKARANWEEKNTNINLPFNPSSNYTGSSEPVISNSLSSKKIVSWRKFAIAAAVIAVIGLAVALYMKNSSRTELVTNGNKTKTDSATNVVINDRSTVPSQAADQDITKLSDSDKIPTTSNKEPISNSEKSDKLFAKYFSPDTQLVSAPDILQEPISLYESKKYEEALAAFQNIDLAATTRGDVQEQDLTFFYTYYYRGLCFLSENNFAKAIEDLQKAISKRPQADLKVKAQWYLALAYLKTGEMKKANSYLDAIISNRRVDGNQEKAASLKKEIKTR